MSTTKKIAPSRKPLFCIRPAEAPPPLPVQPRRALRKPVRKPERKERWVAFEQGRFAHRLRDDDLFPAERTLCGKPAFDADLRRLPVFNSFPADYQLCRMCCVLLYRERR